MNWSETEMLANDFLIEEREINGGIQKVYKFENGYGASVVKHSFSYGNEHGKWELAVTFWEGDKWGIEYGTSITNDVLGHLDWDEVEDILRKIKDLEGRN